MEAWIEISQGKIPETGTSSGRAHKSKNALSKCTQVTDLCALFHTAERKGETSYRGDPKDGCQG
jgi:hypothetical protein